MAALRPGHFDLAFYYIRGFDFEGGHDETNGIDSSGNVITVPRHRHEVSLDFTRYELDVAYAIDVDWRAELRVPYDVKNQDASIRAIDPATSSEQDAMQRNLDLHHRDETYRGFSDLSLLGIWRTQKLFAADDTLLVGFGTSIPVGQTEHDPLAAGQRSEQHQHIQFGTGTFDPLLEVYYDKPLATDWSTGVFALGKFPLYRNDKTYRGPVEVTTGLNVSYHAADWLTVRGNLTGYLQGYSHWDGQRDPNTGLVAFSGLVGAWAALKSGTRLGFDLRIPISQEALGEGDAFDQGITLLLSFGQQF